MWSEGIYIIKNLLEPIVPHIAHEMSLELFRLKNLQNRIKVVDEVFKQDTIKYIVSVNGKKRGDYRCFGRVTKR